MKISHILPALTKGGAEKVVVDLANVSSKMGHEVTVLVGRSVNSDLLRNSLAPSIRVCSVCAHSNSSFKVYVAIFPWLIKNLQWIKNQDILHCHLTFGAVFSTIIWIIYRFTSNHKALIIETNHSVGMPIKKWQSTAFRLMARWRHGYVLMAENSEWKRYLDKAGMPISDFIPNGVEIPKQAASTDEVREFLLSSRLSSTKAIVIGSIGRLVAERNPLALVTVFSEIHKRLAGRVDIQFLMGGEGPEKESVKKLAQQLQIGEVVHLPGLITNPRVAMSTMDLYISLNVGGTTGIAGMEAAALGIPVIALQMSADYTPSDSDWIWSSKDPKALAAKAIEILLDSSLRSRIGQRQKEYVVKNCSAEKMQADYLAFYKRVAEYNKSTR